MSSGGNAATLASIRFVIPGKPQPKERPRFSPKTNTVFTPAATRKWEKHAGQCAQYACLAAGWERPLAGGVRLLAMVVGETLRPMDLDNTAGKALGDALNGIAWYDDRQIHQCEYTAAADPSAPGIYCEVHALDSWDDPTQDDTPSPSDKRARLCGWGGSPEYRAWLNMVARCSNPSHAAYQNYGGRGIRVHHDWRGRRGFWAWLLHVGGRPCDGMELDRIDNNKGYVPGNVHWVTRKDNARNRRSNLLLTANGETKTLAEWAEASGLSGPCIRYRIAAGWATAKAVSQPPGLAPGNRKGRGAKVEAFGIEKSYREWAAQTGLHESTIRKRIKNGLPPESALAPWKPAVRP